jgi:uncharacterized membrane protein
MVAKPPEDPASASIPEPVVRNIAAIRQWKARRRARRSVSDKTADAISRFAGSMPFVYLHLALFGGWIMANLGWVPGIKMWDPTLVVLAMIASVEAIFLSTFVLINQNQMTAEADERAELDLQVGLLNERETTRLITMVQAIADHLGVETGIEHDLGELRQDTEPDVILNAVQQGGEADRH